MFNLIIAFLLGVLVGAPLCFWLVFAWLFLTPIAIEEEQKVSE